MAVSKKDYEAIAAILARHTCLPDGYVVDGVAYALALYFAEQSPRFDKDRFLKASGVPR